MLSRQKTFSLICGLAAVYPAALAVYYTVLNNSYATGSTLFDSAIHGTIIWRSGWDIKPGSVFGDESYFHTHLTPIHYIPSLISYIFPGDRLTYYALVYAFTYGVMIFAAYRLVERLAEGWLLAPVMAAVAGLALFCSQTVFQGEWEIHMDISSSMLALFAYSAYQLRKYRQSAFWFFMVALVREDLGIVFALPLAFLVPAQYLQLRRTDPALAKERLRYGSILFAFTFGCSVLAIYIQKTYFPNYDLFHHMYFSKNDPFGHLSSGLLLERLQIIYQAERGIWAPLVALFVSAIVFRDAQLAASAIAFVLFALPYFLSKNELSATMASYKPFPLVLSLMWPALIGITRPLNIRWRYMVLQAIILICGFVNMSMVTVHIAYARWVPDPLIYNASIYRDLEPRLKRLAEQYPTRLSDGVLALYPYDFKIWWKSMIGIMQPDEEDRVQILIWFAGDKDHEKVAHLLESGQFKTGCVQGTKICISRRLPNATLPIPDTTPSAPENE